MAYIAHLNTFYLFKAYTLEQEMSEVYCNGYSNHGYFLSLRPLQFQDFRKPFIKYLWIRLADRILWDPGFTCV